MVAGAQRRSLKSNVTALPEKIGRLNFGRAGESHLRDEQKAKRG